MKLTCANCQQQVSIEDSKVPSGAFKIKCPKCGKSITGQKDVAPAPPTSSTPHPSAASMLEELHSASAPPPVPSTMDDTVVGKAATPKMEEYVKQEVRAMKQEIMGAMSTLFGDNPKWHQDPGIAGGVGGSDRAALVCEDDQVFVDTISHAVHHLGYSVDVARSTAEALKKIESGYYQLITVDYSFPDDKDGGTKIMAKINGQKTNVRRQNFVVLISAGVKSADANAAFFHGANIIVNKDEIKNLENLIRDGLRHFQQIYSMFNRVLTEKNEKL